MIIHECPNCGTTYTEDEECAKYIYRTPELDGSASELEELRKDKARLDWLEKQEGVAVGDEGYGDYEHYCGRGWSKTVRQLCDEEMQNDPGQPRRSET